MNSFTLDINPTRPTLSRFEIQDHGLFNGLVVAILLPLSVVPGVMG